MNPVLFADYSDPDVIRVGDDFYLVSSSFANVPGLPVLHSRDLVNWTIVGHALAAAASPASTARSTARVSGRRRSGTTRAASGSSGATPMRASS